MCAFKKANTPEVSTFFDDVYRVEDKEFKASIQFIHHKLGMPVDTAVLNEVAQDVKHRSWLYAQLCRFDMLSYFDPNIDQEELCFGKLYKFGYDEETDSVVFIRKEFVKNGNDEGYIYFFKRKEENKKNWMIDYIGIVPTEFTDSTYQFSNSTILKKGLAFTNEEELEKTIEQTLELFTLMGRKRADISSYEDDFYGLFGDF
jgi:hypothetical protein